MEAGRSLLYAPSISRTHFRNSLSPSSVLMLHGQSNRAIVTPTSAVQQFPRSFLTLEQHNNCNSYAIHEESVAQEAENSLFFASRPQFGKEDFGGVDFCICSNVRTLLVELITKLKSTATIDLQNVEDGCFSSEKKEKYHFELYLKIMEHGLHYHPAFRHSLLSTYNLGKPAVRGVGELIDKKIAYVGDESNQKELINLSTMNPVDVLFLARSALTASQDAAFLAKESHMFPHKLKENTQIPSLDPCGSTDDSKIEGKKTVRSNWPSKRQLKKRKVFVKSTDVPSGTSSSMDTEKVKKQEKKFDNSDPLRLFLWGPETKQLLTTTEETDLFARIQRIVGLEAVKEKLSIQFGREPTLTEWAQAIGMSCQDLQAFISSGIRSRNRVIYANFRLVIHVAKQYEGKGLNIQDLLQEGSIGLMKSLDKFKPKTGCRFSTYAYWWIRQSMRKAIFQHSRTIRLPENVFGELKRIRDAKRLCLLQEGHAPTNEEVAKRAGMHVSRLESLLKVSRNPISIQGHTWIDQDTTLQEVTADPEIEIPELAVEKQMMRQRVHGLLSALSPRERKLIRLRFGIEYGEPKSLQQIGDMFGISKERVRQLETQALRKLRASCSRQGLGAYAGLLM